MHMLRTSSSTEVTTVSESVFEEAFQSVITNKSREIDSTTVTLANRLSTSYIEQKKWSEAALIIRSTLDRTWSLFLSVSVNNVTLTSTFLQESIELAERLADCYVQQRQNKKVEDIYLRLFQAALALEQPDNTLLEKVKLFLVNFYDRRGYPNRAISVLQDVLVVYRTRHGLSHDMTIRTLYDLGFRCRTHAGRHPYWIDCYQQIVDSLNKDSDVCHLNAIEAVTIVANFYWEEQRYINAIRCFTVLWNTFVREASEYKGFSDTGLVQELYERYFQCLEETQTNWELLYQVTIGYRETCHKKFGATSLLAAEATLALARVSQASEKHSLQAISLYEELSRSSLSVSVSKTEIGQTLSVLYTKQTKSQSSASTQTEIIEQATSLYLEQLSVSKSKYGYSHQITLKLLRELSNAYFIQGKIDLATNELVNAVAQIISQETSSQKILESGRFIAEIFLHCKQLQLYNELILELHRQIVAKNASITSKWSFDPSSCGQTSLVFLAALEFYIQTGTSVRFSEIMADIVAEAVYYEQFRHLMKAPQDFDRIGLVAAPLRRLLVKRKLYDLVATLEEEIVQLFFQQYQTQLKLLKKESPHIFVVAILERLGNRKSKSFPRSVLLASNDLVKRLIEEGKFTEAYDVANCVFTYANSRDEYSAPQGINYGFSLASVVGDKGKVSPERALPEHMYRFSKHIFEEMLRICKRTNVNFPEVQREDLNWLVVFLGEQRDYVNLEV